MAPDVSSSNFPQVSVLTHIVLEAKEADSVKMGNGDPFPGKIFILTRFQHHRFKIGSHSLGECGRAVSEIPQTGGQVS
jgi:hypothetical protein